jgi:hypothetical protein
VAATSRGSAAASKAGGKKKRKRAGGEDPGSGGTEVPAWARDPRDLEISSVDSFQVACAPQLSPPPCRSAAP